MRAYVESPLEGEPRLIAAACPEDIATIGKRGTASFTG
jgi:hypothetical protein